MFGLFSNTTDPVCGMKINKKEAKFSVKHKDCTYFFCSQNCKDKFEQNPGKFSVQENHSGGGCCH